MKNLIITIIATLTLISCSNIANERQADERKQAIEQIKNDLKLIQHNVEYAKKDAVKIFNDGNSDTPLSIYDGLTNIDSLVISIENKLKTIE